MEDILKNTPEIWLTFGMLIHQDFLLVHPDFFSGITDIAQGFSPAQRQEVHALLHEILSDKYNNTERVQFWNNSGASFSVLESEIVPWLEQVLEAVKKERNL